ncbi:MAG: DUF2252 family protein [Cyclobacteriaceae bacterium]|nr:DUF2252 family protein [Cyclobacteriaceae bacterium]
METLARRIIHFHADRQEPTLKRKYALMAIDPFTFYRATCFLFYEDLAKNPIINRGPLAWICGDLHLENFGSYRATNGLVYFDINDFDEAQLAPALWEVQRFLCSIGLATETWNYSQQEASSLMETALSTYVDLLCAGKPYSIEREVSPPLIQDFFDKAEREREKDLLKERVDKKKQKLFLIQDKTFALDQGKKEFVQNTLSQFFNQKGESLKVVDVAFRIAGTGSLSVARYVALAWDESKEKWRLLDIKKSTPSSLAQYVTVRQPKWESEAHRIVGAQRFMQYALPRFIDTIKIGEEDFVIKQLQPSAQKIDHQLCKSKLKNSETIIITMAQALASAQLRSTARLGSANTDELIAFASVDNWQKELITLAIQYTETMKNYFKDYKKLYKVGSFFSR